MVLKTNVRNYFWITAIAAGSCLMALASAMAQTTVNINGLNGWSDASGNNVPTLVTNAMNFPSGPPAPGYQSGCLVMDAVAGDPLREPNVSVPSNTNTTDVTTLTMWQYVPSSTVTTAYGFWDPGIVWETGYIASGDPSWAQQNYFSGSFSIIPNKWEEISYTWDPNNGFSEYYGTPGAMTLAASLDVADAQTLMASFGGSWPYAINNFGWYNQSSFLDPGSHPIAGPIYWDDMQLTVGNKVVWSDNFDDYIPAVSTGPTSFVWKGAAAPAATTGARPAIGTSTRCPTRPAPA